MASATQISLESDTYAGRPDDVIPFTGHSQRRALLVIRFAVLDLGSCSKDVNWSRRDRLRKTVGSSRASCE